MPKITALPPSAAVTADDLFVMVNDPGGVPVTQRATFTQLKTLLDSIYVLKVGDTITPGPLIIKGAGTGTGIHFQTQNGSSTPIITCLDNGQIGIGKSVGLVEAFEVVSQGDLTQDSFGMRSTFSVAPAANNTTLHWASNLSQMMIPAGNVFQVGAWVSAYYGYLRNEGAGTQDDMRNLAMITRVTAGGTVNNLYGTYSDVLLAGNSTVTNLFHHYAKPCAKTGANTLTSEYGFYCGNLTQAVNKYAFYSAGPQSSFTSALFSGTLEMVGAAQMKADGTAALPGFATSGNANMGMFRVGSNILGFSTSGTEKLRLDATNLALVAGYCLKFTAGSNQRAGNLTLIGGTLTVANTTVTANTVILLTRKTAGGTIGFAVTYTVIAATSFTVTSDNALDTSTYSYLLIET